MADTTEAVERLEAMLDAGGVACASQWPIEVSPYIRTLLSERTALLERVERAERENERLRPKPSALASPWNDPKNWGVCYRPGPPSAEDYEEAAADMIAAAKSVREGDNMGCRVCEDSGHSAGQCHHNALLLARKWTAASAFWQCWHCGYVATNDAEAREHFGNHDGETPSCIQNAKTRAQAAETKLATLTEALEWFSGRRRLSLEWHQPVYGDDDDDAEEWRVHRRHGGINDREWEVVGAGDTALKAIMDARQTIEGVLQPQTQEEKANG